MLALSCASSGVAGTVQLGSSGWQASWDSSLDPYVDIIVDAVVPSEDAVIIQKAAEFIQGPGFGGLFPPIAITFTQTDANAVSRIVINDEIITNNTGHDWLDFHMQLVDSGDAMFNAADTNASAGGNGFSIAPFTVQSFGPGPNPPYTTYNLRGGVVPDGTVWFPGSGAADGELFIDTITGAGTVNDPFTVFTLKEWPTVPEPASGLLVCLGLLIVSPWIRPARTA